MTTTTWADGFGRWHVTLPDKPLAKIDALKALTDEILVRSPRNTDRSDILAYVKSSMVRVQTNEPNLIEYIEYGIEADTLA